MDKRGFLLFEVMVSIVVITVCLLFVARSYSSSTNAIRKSRELIRAALLLENKMWELEQIGEIEESRVEGNFEEDENYSWIMSAQRMEDTDLNLVRLEILETEAPERGKYSISTYLKNKEKCITNTRNSLKILHKLI